jgi:hypothetical protein
MTVDGSEIVQSIDVTEFTDTAALNGAYTVGGGGEGGLQFSYPHLSEGERNWIVIFQLRA